MPRPRSRQGFTIIEVVLVLAIAGLIFLMIFVALPGLQRAQRDKLRKQDVGVVVAAVQQYMKNNSGRPPDPTASTSVGNNGPDDPFYDADGDGIVDNWQTTADSAQLRKYLAGLSEEWVTTTVGVTKAPAGGPGSYLRMAIGNEDMAGHIEVIIGAKCPTSMTGVNGQYLEMELTSKRGDIVVFRYLEAGYYYCENVSHSR